MRHYQRVAAVQTDNISPGPFDEQPKNVSTKRISWAYATLVEVGYLYYRDSTKVYGVPEAEFKRRSQSVSSPRKRFREFVMLMRAQPNAAHIHVPS